MCLKMRAHIGGLTTILFWFLSTLVVLSCYCISNKLVLKQLTDFALLAVAHPSILAHPPQVSWLQQATSDDRGMMDRSLLK